MALNVNHSQDNRITSGLVGEWSFNGPDMNSTTALDASGNANHGTLGGTNKPTLTVGKVGQGLLFNSSSVTVPNASSLNITGGLTVSAWINPSSLGGGYQTVLSKRGPGNTTDYELSLDTTTGALIFYDGTIYLSSYIPTINKWTHVTVTVDPSGNLTIYANGVSVYTNTGVSLSANTASLFIGVGGGNGSGQFFKGKLDEVRVYNRALSAVEAQELYLMGK